MRRNTERAAGTTSHGSAGAEQCAGTDQSAQRPGEEARDDRRQAAEVPGRHVHVFGANHAVDEADGECESVGIAEHAGQPCRGRVLSDEGAGVEPATHEGDGLVRQRGIYRGDGSGLRQSFVHALG